MAAKLLQTLADDNSDLQKKIGCMNGIFQIFDRHHVLTSRRKTLTLGSAHANSINLERDSVDANYQQRSAFQFQDSNFTSGNGSSEKLTRLSTESTRVSFSSSCSSSSPLSSELNREVSVEDRVIFQESPTSDPVMSQRSGSATRMGLDLRDVVRDSMYRDNRREDSPRPYGLKHSTPVNFNESCRALAKLRKTSQHYYDEVDIKDASRYFVDSREKSKSGKKLKEFPKLSLDSRDHVDLKLGNKLSESFSTSSSMNKVSGSPRRPPSVVAKLMGLETLPGSPLGRDKINMFDDDNNSPFSFSRSLRENSLNRTLRFSPSSPRSLGKEPTSSSSSPRWRSSDFVMKPLSSLRYPIEPAPWKQNERNSFFQKLACKSVKSLTQSMEGRLKDLEFKHSGRDLRALKDIVEAVQSKGLFDTRKQPQCLNLEAHRDYELSDSATSTHASRVLRNQVMPSGTRGPIVIMKPARLVEKSGIPPSSLIPIHSLSGLNKTCREEPVSVKRNPTSRKLTKDCSSGNQRVESCTVSSVDKKSSGRTVRSSQVSKESISKSSGSASPKLRQMKKENEKLSRPPTSPSDSSKSRKQTNRQPTESSTSLAGRSSRSRAQRSLQLQQNEDQLGHISNKSRTEREVTVSIKQSTEADVATIPSVIEAAKAVVSNLKQNKFSLKFSEDGSSEHPSPVSVLNTSIYRDIKPSPVKMQASEGSGIDPGDEEDQWNPAYSFSETTTNFSPEINRKKLQNVEYLVQKLKRLNSSHDEASQDYIASLCENNDPKTDHRYISEILLASGLLLRDFGSGSTPSQLHPSGYPINPELFLVLEQTKGRSSSTKEKLNRKLVFDAVNEMLVKKLASLEDTPDPWMKRAYAMKRVTSAQQLLKELCSEIEIVQKQAKKRSDNFLLLEEEEEDFLKCILDEDMTIQSEKWTEFDDVIPGLVLDLERLLFKDLVNEIVHGEIGRLQANSGR